MLCIEQQWTFNFLSHVTNASNSFLSYGNPGRTHYFALSSYHSMKIHGSVNHQQLTVLLSIGPTLICILMFLVLYTCLLRQPDHKCGIDLCFFLFYLISFWTSARNWTTSKYPAIKQHLSVFKIRTFRGELAELSYTEFQLLGHSLHQQHVCLPCCELPECLL